MERGKNLVAVIDVGSHETTMRIARLKRGSDADLVLWDPKKTFRYFVAASKSRTDYSYLDGVEITGAPDKVLLRGEVIVDGERWNGRRGGGKFIFRKPRV